MPATNIITLENDQLRARFNAENGALLSLTNRATGWELLRREALGLSFRMEVPLPERHMNYIQGEQQTLARYEVSADGARLTFHWQTLHSEHGGEHAIGFTGVVTLERDGLLFTGTVDNCSELTVEAVCYPCLGDLTPPTPTATLERLSQGYGAMSRVPLYPSLRNDCGYWGFDYVGNNGTATNEGLFMLVNSETQGLYLGAHDPSLKELVNFFFISRPGYLDSYSELMPKGDEISGHTIALELSVVHFPYAAPGEQYTLTPIALQVYSGDWHDGVDCYKRWRASWFTRPATPAWATGVHAWQQLQVNGAEDDLRYRYSELVEIGRECAEQGVKAIQLVGWNKGGQDRGNPAHDIDPRLGTWEELRDAIAAVQAMGVQMILFSKFTWWDRSDPRFASEGIRHATKDPYGDAHWHSGYQYQTFTQSADLNTRRFSPMCQQSAAWREVAAKEFTKLVDLGAAGMLYDECQHHGPARYCFDPNHGHRVPAFVYGGDLPLIRRLKEITDARSPQFLHAGEACYDVELQEYHLHYLRLWGKEPHLQRYIDPFVPMMDAVTGFDDRNQLNKCLQYRYIISYEPFNFKGRLRDFPLTLVYGQQLDALRTRYQAYLWDAEFRDTVGATVTADGKPYRDYAVFKAEDGRRAAVIANIDPEKTITATLTFTNSRAPLTQVTPEVPDAQPCDGQVSVGPRSVVVVMEG